MHAPVPQTHSRLTLPLLILVSMMGPLALNILMASMPGMVKTLGTTREMVQLTMSLFLLAQAVSQLFIGSLADRFGRRPVLIISTMVYVGASIGASMAATIEILVVLRILQAFGATAGLTLSRTIVRDLYPRDKAASMLGYVIMGMVIAPMMGPAIGAVLDEMFGWRSIFIACAMLGASALTLTIFILRETRPVAIAGTTVSEIAIRARELLRDRRFLGYLGSTTGASAMFYAFLGGAPFLVIDVLKLSKSEYGTWYVLMSFGYMVGNFFSGRFSNRLGIDRMIWLGNASAILFACCMLVPTLLGVVHPAVLFVPGMLINVSNGLTMPNAIAGGVSINTAAAGAASGVVGFLQMGVGALVSYGTNLVTRDSALPMAIIITALGVLTHLSAEWGRRAIPGASSPLR